MDGGASKGSTVQTVMDILGSKGGQTAMSAAGAGLQAYGQAQQLSSNKKQAAAQMRQQADQFAATSAANQLQNDRSNQLSRSTSALAASPLGANQGYAQKQALVKALLGQARNFSVTPSDPAVAAAMGKVSGGMRLPEGGLDASMLERLFGDEATQQAITQREKQIGQVNPRNPTFDLGTLYGKSADGSENAFTSDISTSNREELGRQMDEEARQRAIIQAAIDDQVNGAVEGEQKAQGSSWKKKLAKVGLIAGAGTLAAMTGGAASPLLMAAIGAGTGAASGALDGGGWKGALLGAATGAATGGIGGGAGGSVAKQALGTALKTTAVNAAKNPMPYISAVRGR